MAGVFLSYSRADRALAERVIRGLRRIGVEVWWDQDMPGVDWQQELERELGAMVAVAVLWTPNSLTSKYVRDEARLGLHHEKLVNVMAGAPSPPFPFDRVNGLSIDGWDGVSAHGGWKRMVQTIETLAVAAGSAQLGEISGSLNRSEQDARAKRAAMDEAERAFHDAQLLEAEASEADGPTREALRRAEDDLGSVRATPVGPAILRAAQQEFDSAEAQSDQTASALRAARTQLSAASRALARAKADWDALASDGANAPEAVAVGSASVQSERPAQTSPVSSRFERSARTVDAADQAEAGRGEPVGPATSTARLGPAPLAQTDGTAMQARRMPTRALLAATGVLVVVALGAGLAFHRSGASSLPPKTVSLVDSSQTVSAASASAASAPVSSPAADPASGLIGSWSVAGLGCDSPVTFSEPDGVLSRAFAGVKTSISPTSGLGSGVAVFRAKDGTRYQLAAGGLSMIPAGATKAMEMARCAG